MNISKDQDNLIDTIDESDLAQFLQGEQLLRLLEHDIGITQ